MSKIEDVLAHIRQNPRDVRFNDLCKVCDHYFGVPHQGGAVIEFTKPRGKAIQG